ncbi:MurT ligase domain-containing protein [Streptomyces sp. NBS 14/10]|uniref:MurT ligase domain-containing protein n=1 Tax=Streptomyces sp. NBS 14/10 TaxID=1945643 RepID=UPI000B7E99E0|nr:MurT ligase domain-containing protein [Streptomyces sp. NBS 14/10]KAK1177244.1 MurT ligase domain-containing protein [Streptomyces sp. NBS 14/10]NUS82217.1 DUF1727 domain-containing protein [Streptomyces sp.]
MEGEELAGTPSRRGRLSLRSRLALLLGRAASAVYRRMGWKGAGGVLGDVTLYFSPGVLRELGRSMHTVLVTGTNGKTTTSALTAVTLESRGSVAANSSGANLPHGIATALIKAPSARFGVIEVDERHFPSVCSEIRPTVVVLLNLSRDQLDRNPEPRVLAERWRTTLTGLEDTTVVANSDDPLICWVATAARRVIWVAGGGQWSEDSVHCPDCGGTLRTARGEPWRCSQCPNGAPRPDWTVEDGRLVWRTGSRSFRPALALPGRANQINAAMALAAGNVLGAEPEEAVSHLERVGSVSGRYESVEVGSREVRLLLAKNPASWMETFEVLGETEVVVIVLNSRRIDGHDPSWIWDVDFRRIAGPTVFVTGDRRLDLAVRLHVDGIEFTVADSLREACEAAPPGRIDVVANYTGFFDVISAVRAGREVTC